ncbi:MAG: ATP-dependent RNA helicase [Deltaproteobacteria bacterium]|nr:MAG: ATP-dependent RNA helicase [Deltaproteobacteria bacterium]
MARPLPIDAVLPEVIAAVRDRGVAVLVAPPGAGKTTRVPGALVDAGVVGGEVVVLQPRRLAARLAASRVAAERGGEIGGEVGYEVRFDRRVGPETRIRFATEGVLTRRLLADRELRGVGCVIVDEFHERNLDGDLALALVARLRARRPELRLVVMSATLDAEPVAAFLGAPVVRSEGRTFQIAIEHVEQPDDRPLGRQVAAAVRRVAQDGLDGDVLVFLPGAGEIRRCQDDLAEVAAIFDLAVLPLYGDLPADEQDRAVRPARQRKVILATNVAETSVTIDGVVCVIDSGLARIARHSPWTGLPSLAIEPVSRASCAQRAGRAGRTRPGRVIRLYTRHDHDTRRAFEVPEIARADLAGAALELYGAGLPGLAALRWFEPPPAAAAAAAEELIVRLGAVERVASEAASPGPGSLDEAGSRTTGLTHTSRAAGSTRDAASQAATSNRDVASQTEGSITPLGRRMLRFPAHPRLARILCEAEDRGVAEPACAIAALLDARELRLERRGPRAEARIASPSDLIDDLDALYDARRRGLRPDRLRASGLDPYTASAVDRAANQLARIARDARPAPAGDDAVDRELQIAILAGFPDRVGKRRAPRSAEIVLAGGGSGTLAPSSAVIDAELVVCVDIADTGGRGQASKVQIRRASAIEASWLLDLYLDRIAERDELVWNAGRQRVERVVQLTYDGLVIDEQRDVEGARRAGPAAAAVLAREALAAGIEQFVDQDALAQWRARVTLAARLVPGAGLTAPTDDALAQLIARACDGAISFDELRKLGLLDLLDAQLGEHRALVDRLAPTHLRLPRRGRAPIHYELDQPPWIASRMQDFFGLARAPTIGDGRVPLVLHLLAPNQRPVQVTTDLPGFWVKHYPALRKQLMRRYPKHAWPEDPTALITEDRDG